MFLVAVKSVYVGLGRVFKVLTTAEQAKCKKEIGAARLICC